MAEVFGTAASVLQVAEVGFSLATTLYKYASSVKGAEQDVKKIARDVKLTSKVLEQTHEQLKSDQQARMCTDDALLDLEDVLEGCKEAFQEVDDALNKSLRPGPGGKLGISAMEKLKWPLRSNKLDILRANLEKLKTTLLLMLSVLAYGSKLSQQPVATTQVTVELTLEKLQIQNLVQAKDEATQRYEELSEAFKKLETRINSTASQLYNPATPMHVAAIGSVSMAVMPDEKRSAGTTLKPNIEAIPSALRNCVQAVGRLATSIDQASQRWEKQMVLEHSDISRSLEATANAIQALELHAGFQKPNNVASTHNHTQLRPPSGKVTEPDDDNSEPGLGAAKDIPESCENSESSRFQLDASLPSMRKRVRSEPSPPRECNVLQKERHIDVIQEGHTTGKVCNQTDFAGIEAGGLDFAVLQDDDVQDNFDFDSFITSVDNSELCWAGPKEQKLPSGVEVEDHIEDENLDLDLELDLDLDEGVDEEDQEEEEQDEPEDDILGDLLRRWTKVAA